MAVRSCFAAGSAVRLRIGCLFQTFTKTSAIFPQRLQSTNMTNITKKGQRWNPFIWYNLMLEKYPIRTKMITSGVLYGLGDIIAQKGTQPGDLFDKKRCLRGCIYGLLILAPLAHFHFAFLEWLVVVKYPVKSSLMPVVKMVIDQFGYWTPGILVVYHTSMGAMEGLNLEQIKERLKVLLWPSLKACWILWPAVMLINFKFVPVAHQLNVCLVVSLGWATFLSYLGGTAAKQDISTANQSL